MLCNEATSERNTHENETDRDDGDQSDPACQRGQGGWAELGNQPEAGIDRGEDGDGQQCELQQDEPAGQGICCQQGGEICYPMVCHPQTCGDLNQQGRHADALEPCFKIQQYFRVTLFQCPGKHGTGEHQMTPGPDSGGKDMSQEYVAVHGVKFQDGDFLILNLEQGVE